MGELAVLSEEGQDLLKQEGRQNQDSLIFWAECYWRTKVAGSAPGTVRAKKEDLELFLTFFSAVVGSFEADYWTPSLSKSFKSWLQKSSPRKPARRHKAAYAPTSVNRILATLRHFARFVGEHRPFEAGNPFDGVKDLALSRPEWKGLEQIELMRLRAALDQVTKLSTKKGQMPARNRAVFTLALNTGLRTSEIEGLEFDQYQGKYLFRVRGKGEHYDDIYVSAEARATLDSYIKVERGVEPGPLFVTNRGGRMLRQQIDRFFRQLAAHANARLPKDEQIKLHAHMLRHTSVKRVHEERGELAAKRFSRHRSFGQLERYASQTQAEHEEMVDSLWS